MIKLRATFTAEAFEATTYIALSAVLGGITFWVLLPTLLVGTALPSSRWPGCRCSCWPSPSRT